MKCLRLLTALSLVFLLPILLFAQTERMVGIKGGYSLSNFWGNGTKDLTSSLNLVTTNLDERNLPWFCVSLFSSHEIIPEFTSVQSELVYYRGGKAFKGTVGGAERHFSLEVDYVALPVMLKIHFPFPLKPSIYAGPQVSWMFRSRALNFPAAADTTQFFRGTDVRGEVFNRNTNIIDLGFVAGLDFGIPFGPGKVVVDGRYQMGAIDVFNYSAARSVKNYDFLIMLGYALNFGGVM